MDQQTAKTLHHGDVMLAQHVQCQACGGTLHASATELRCQACSARYPWIDGIVDFVGGRFDTQLDPHQYDSDHGISDSRSAADYQDIREILGDRWPASLGSMLEIGCGTGAFSRAVLAADAVRDAVLTDVSVSMLRICKAHLERLGLASRLPLTFATYSTDERCFRDGSFDSCVGIQVLHHLPDYGAFLHQLFRCLKPGGIAFFAEPALPFHIALASGLADFLAEQIAADPTASRDRQQLLNWIAVQRREVLHQGELAYLATLEDKHMFVPADFAAAARRIGFTTVEAFPLAPDPLGMRMAGGLFFELGLSPEGTDEAMRNLPRHTERHFASLSPEDRSASYLFWLRKPETNRTRATRRGAAKPGAPQRATVDLWPAHWRLALRAEPDVNGLVVHVGGWCLLKSDIKWLRIAIGGQQRDAPVWYPRPDVQAAFNRSGTYATWNALCCGVNERLVFDGVAATGADVPIRAQLVLANGFVFDLPVQRTRLGEPMLLAL